MRRRAFLAGVAAGTASLAGCGHGPDALAWRFDDAAAIGGLAPAGDRLAVTAVAEGDARLLVLGAATGTTEYERPVPFGWSGRPGPPVAVAGDALLVWARPPGEAEGLVAVDAATGGTRWQTRSPPWLPATDGRRAYLGDGRDVRALALADGSERWRVTPPMAGNAPRPLSAAAGRLLVSVGASVLALGTAAGEPRWRVERGFLNRAPVDAGGSTVYVGSEAAEPDGNPGAIPVSAHGIDGGEERWRLLLDGVAAAPQAAPAGAYVNTVLDPGRALYALRPGGTSWRVGGLRLPPGAFTDSRLFAVDPGAAVVGVTPGGAEAWRFELPATLPGGHPVVVPLGESALVAAGSTATALAAGDGRVAWEYDAGATVRDVVVDGDRAYLLTAGAVHALTAPEP